MTGADWSWVKAVPVYGRATMTPERGGWRHRWYDESGAMIREVWEGPLVAHATDATMTVT